MASAEWVSSETSAGPANAPASMRTSFSMGSGLAGVSSDGLIRMDLSHGLKGPAKEFRIDLYLDALM